MTKALKYINLGFFLAMIFINLLANTVPLGYGSTGAISAKYPNLFTPAPVTFSIWGVIYLLLAFFIAYQLGIFGSDIYTESIVKQISLLFAVSCILNIAWIFSWHYEVIWLSMIFMTALLVTLIMINAKVSPNAIERATGINTLPLITKICTYTFEIYLGWIVAATIANLNVLLVDAGWNRFGLSEEIMTIAFIVIGTLLGIVFILAMKKYMSAFAIIWAYIGILVQHLSRSGYNGKYPQIITFTIICVALIAAAGLAKIMIDSSYDDLVYRYEHTI